MATRRTTAKATETVTATVARTSRFAPKATDAALPGVTRGRPAGALDTDLLDAVRQSYAESRPFGVELSELVGSIHQGETSESWVKRAQAFVRRHVESVNAQDGVRYGVSFGIESTELWFRVSDKIEGRGRKPKARA